jgi:hypothetical protein
MLDRWQPPEAHLVMLPIAVLLAITMTATKGSFAASQRISHYPLIRVHKLSVAADTGFWPQRRLR